MLQLRKANLHRTVQTAIALLLMAVGGNMFCAALADEGYPFDMKKKYAKAFAAYQKVVPPMYKKTTWVYSLDGTASPMDAVESGGKKWLIGSVCQPHDCGDNQIAFLIAADGSVAFGLLRSRNLTSGKDILFGKPDATQLALLKKQIM